MVWTIGGERGERIQVHEFSDDCVVQGGRGRINHQAGFIRMTCCKEMPRRHHSKSSSAHASPQSKNRASPSTPLPHSPVSLPHTPQPCSPSSSSSSASSVLRKTSTQASRNFDFAPCVILEKRASVKVAKPVVQRAAVSAKASSIDGVALEGWGPEDGAVVVDGFVGDEEVVVEVEAEGQGARAKRAS